MQRPGLIPPISSGAASLRVALPVLISALGISVGCLFHAFASAFGLTAIIATSALAFTIIKLAGGAYLIYLGVRMLFSKPAVLIARSTEPERRPLQKIFWQAVLTNILNPKVVLFFCRFSRNLSQLMQITKPLHFCCSAQPSSDEYALE
jgi:threonine/homoserine/homoserine lactone efflux protein